jgi:signal transduction histidine kinase/CheY-like chemotaxis protein
MRRMQKRVDGIFMNRKHSFFTSRLPADVQKLVQRRFLGLILPVLLIIIVPLLLHTLLLSANPRLRLIPTVSGGLLLLICYWLYGKGRTRIAAVLLLVSFCTVVVSAVILSGGIHAPAFYGVIPIIMIICSLFGNRFGAVAIATAVGLALVMSIAELRGWISVPSEPPPLYRLGIHIAWVAISAVVIMVVVAMLNEALEKSEQARQNAEQSRFLAEAMQHQSFQMTALLAPDGTVDSVNQTALDFLRLSASDTSGKPFEQLPWWQQEDRSRLAAAIVEAASGIRRSFECIFINSEKQPRTIDFAIGPLYNESGQIVRLMAEAHDVTELVGMRQTLSQREKMDSIGELAGGIAHDFNNMLGGIIGAAEMLQMNGPEDREQFEKSVNTLMKAATRASSLTGKLLVFSRRKTGHRETISFHTVISDTIELLRHTIDRRIEVVSHTEAEFDRVSVDVAQMQNVLLNLGVNSRDAMPSGGKIIVSTSNIHMTASDCERSAGEMSPGRYLQVLFRDTGSGMDDITKRRIFEPYFTTKTPERGTGIGLAAAWGTLHAHGGDISLESQIGEGTTFRLLIPVADVSSAPEETSGAAIHRFSDDGVVLVIDDEEVVLDATEVMLSSLGYTVLKTSDSAEGISLFQQHHRDIKFVVLDMVMPHMDGAEVFGKLREIHSEVRVILATGYAPGDAVQRLRKNGVRHVLHKPYRRNALIQAIQLTCRV